MAQVSISNVKKSYGAVSALTNISLDIPTGTFFTLLGPSGCGKTTLLRTIAGFHRQDQGSITIDGEPIDNIPVHRRDVGMVFQDYAIFPHLTVRQNVAFGLKQRGIRRRDIESRVTDILKVVQLDHLSGRMPHELSGGQQQRVGLARAVVTRPKVLLMDEPLSNLDAQLRIDLRRELRVIQKQLGITTIYVTHDQEEALEMSDFVCVMHKGIIQQSDTPWTIYHQPANRFVASFVGSNNFLPLYVTQEQTTLCQQLVGRQTLAHFDLSLPRQMILSIRPEKVSVVFRTVLEEAVSGDSFELQATLVHQSFAGRELRLSANAADHSALQIVTEPTTAALGLKPGDPLCLRFPRSAINLFEPGDNGRRLDYSVDRS